MKKLGTYENNCTSSNIVYIGQTFGKRANHFKNNEIEKSAVAWNYLDSVHTNQTATLKDSYNYTLDMAEGI